MAIQLVRRPGAGVDLADDVAARAWIRAQVQQQIVTRGEPLARIWMLGADFVEWLDLNALGKTQPDAHVGLTFQLLRRRGAVARCFLVARIVGVDAEQAPRHFAFVLEQRDRAAGTRSWLAMLEYRADPQTGLGHPLADWQPDGETDDPSALPPFLAGIVSPPAGARAALVREAGDRWVPDIKTMFGDLKPHVQPPEDAKRMVELAGALAVEELLQGRVQGTVVVRIAGRSWEKWVLTGDMPGSTDEMIRWIANHREPAADGVALAQIAVRPDDAPPVPGMQVIGELGGSRVETWAPLEFPEGPRGPKRIPRIHWWPAAPVPPEHRWLGVRSTVELEEPPAVDEAAPTPPPRGPARPVRPIRRPLDGLSPFDVDAVREWAIRRANDDVLRHARVTPRLVLVCHDHLEDVELADVEGDPVAAFLLLHERSDVEHRILFGSHPDGDPHVAWVFGAQNDDERSFWGASRPFRRLLGGLGSGETSWELAWGVALSGAMPPIDTLARNAPPLELLPAVPPRLPRVRFRSEDAAPQAVVPTDPVAAVNAVTQLGYEATLFREPFEGVFVFVFRGRTLEHWHVIGEIPFGLDDLVRAVCAKGDPPSAVVVLRVDLFEHGGQHFRATKTTSEAGGLRWERVLAMLFAEGDPDHRPSEAQIYASHPQPVGDDGWIGVPPITGIDLFTKGPEA